MKILLVLLALAIPAFAQSADSKKRLVFPTNGDAATPTPTPMQALAPEEVLRLFFEDLKADKLDAAYQGLVKNTVLSERAGTTDQLKEKTRSALDHFGPVKGYEIVENLQVGDSLFRYTCVSLNEDIPMRWRFYFYRSANQWKVIDLRVDDGIADLFEEVSRSRRK
ncbi:MAG: hypothetical protein ACKOAS_06435 [Verrucomicrobiota bacterium]